MSQGDRKYECVVYGATGYTGKYAAEHIATNLPTDFRWAIAGRSESKLNALAHDIHALNTDRPRPAIEVAQNTKTDILQLAKQTQVLITTVGPYHKYGSAVFEACAEAGTHYLDVTGEVPWVYDMVQKYDAVAKRTGAIMIPQCGIESAPTDLTVWLLATHVRKTLNTGLSELLYIMWDLNSAPSGGTLDTVLTLFDTYSITQVAKAMSPYSLSTIPPSVQAPARPLTEKLTGIRHDPDLGLLTDSLQGPTDAPIVNRSWSLYNSGKLYGSKFRFSGYMKAKNSIHAFLVHLALTFGFASLLFPPVRWLLKKFVYQPGEGVSREQASKEYCEWRAIANADVSDPADPKRAFGRFRWNGSMYGFTGVLVAEAAITLSRDKTFAHELGGGVVTPATLGAPYLERLQKAGFITEVKTLP
ncbi:hypothetical protein AC578_6623 [Pseudocercospora eumusae]|uniref:Saccharopine dehydrogenase NADP binding domain-containing protein n=1 Tax=Pseudocercospora eumusae TaxID=321146 RepID=A0A139HG98_9PEZI|nr:hypothetical protein AC578_6623 [Pseudocercospora eumusae]